MIQMNHIQVCWMCWWSDHIHWIPTIVFSELIIICFGYLQSNTSSDVSDVLHEAAADFVCNALYTAEVSDVTTKQYIYCLLVYFHCLFIFLFVWLFVCLFVFLYVCLNVYLFACLLVYLFVICLFIQVSNVCDYLFCSLCLTCLFVYLLSIICLHCLLSLFLFVLYLFVCFLVCFFVCLMVVCIYIFSCLFFNLFTLSFVVIVFF